MKKKYLLPEIDLILFLEDDDILTSSSVTTNALELADKALRTKDTAASVDINSIIVLK